MKKVKKVALTSLLAICSGVQSSELDDLIQSSSVIVDQINKGILMTGAAMDFANTGTGLSNGQLAGTSYISSDMVSNYNLALSGMVNYLPYGSAQQYLEDQAQSELDQMDDAIDAFTSVVVDMLAVQQVAELADAASTPDEEAAVQDFVGANTAVLTIDQEDADTYNQSLSDIEEHANNASAFIAVSANADAVSFLDQGAMDNNTRIEDNTLSYSASNQAISIAWSSGSLASSVYLNGTDNFGIDIYMTDVSIMEYGGQSELYLTGPTYLGYECFTTGLNCEETDGGG